ncbi:hypothetical protein [Chromobacterium sp. IIBBL 290-4]|nr:hypothetical protein [Chromobacterium sp. IIBBL 290-4]UTH73691.1 hypothetical protein NKT35_19430 [Chromobacterium sp. IIBBL 290-4]
MSDMQGAVGRMGGLERIGQAIEVQANLKPEMRLRDADIRLASLAEYG